jgi:hypothetical protein
MVTLYYGPSYFTTSLNVGGGINDTQTTGIVIQSVSGLDITKPGILCISYADPIDTSVAEWITFTSINGSNELQGVTRGQEGYAAKTHLNGATIVFPISKSHINNINIILAEITGSDTAVGKSATQTLTSKTLTSPKVGTSINDTNGNEIIKTPATASAVNEITATNAATGTNPKISATGGDTNIDLLLAGKGTGSARHSGTYDGWTDANETWTYASGTTITVPTGAASRYQIGDKIKLTQTTAKYFCITTVADTLLTVTGGDSYSVANAAISANYYSHEENPLGFPSSFNYATSITITAPSGTAPTFSTKIARFSVKGRSVFFTFILKNAAGGTAGSGAVTVYVSLPITAVNTDENPTGGGLWYNGAAQNFLLANPTTGATVYFRKVDTSVLAASDFSNASRQWYGYCTFEI